MATINPDQIVNEVKKYLGDPYVWGAEGPSSFDCSGLVEYVFKNLGLTVPRTSQEQYAWSQGKSIPVDQVQPGDLVFYAGSDGSASSPGHVGIAIGNGQIIHAPRTGQPVKVAGITDSGKITGIKRMPGVTSSGLSSIGGSSSNSGSEGSTVTQTGLPSLGGLFSLPGEITKFFTEGTDALTSTAQSFSLFFRPTTYIRIGSGIFGLVFVIVSIFFLIREAQNSG